jgi:hypothetical protein
MDDDDLIHVYPLFGREHVTSGRECWCQPEPDIEQPLVLIHHAEQ